MVKVKTQGDVDIAKLRREIEEQYPGAKIEGLEKQPMIRVIVGEESQAKPEEEKAKKKSKKKPLIRIIE